MSENIPDTLSTITSLPLKPGQPGYYQRARSLVRGERANTLPPVKPGARVFRVNPDPDEDPRLRPEFLDSQEGRDMLRAWGAKNGFDVKPRGKVPGKLRAAFVAEAEKALARHREAGRAAMRAWGLRNGYEVGAREPVPDVVRAGFMKENGIWTVEIVSSRLPRGRAFSRHFHVRQGEYTRRRTIDPDMVRRSLGAELYNLLWEVTT
jgi:hypothetical protein